MGTHSNTSVKWEKHCTGLKGFMKGIHISSIQSDFDPSFHFCGVPSEKVKPCFNKKNYAHTGSWAVTPEPPWKKTFVKETYKKRRHSDSWINILTGAMIAVIFRRKLPMIECVRMWLFVCERESEMSPVNMLHSCVRLCTNDLIHQ